MRGPIGHTFIYNIIILFIVVVFAFLAGSMSYYRAFKVSNRIVHALEKYEGYNHLSRAEIDRVLNSLGYQMREAGFNCPGTRSGMVLATDHFPANGLEDSIYRYCIYIGVEDRHRRVVRDDYHASSSSRPLCRRFYLYGVTTYMVFDLPLINLVRIPITTRTNRIYKFTTPDTCVETP